MSDSPPRGLEEVLHQVLEDPCRFAYLNSRINLRMYQREVIRAITRSVFNQTGLSFVVMFPRQSGKNELQAQLEAYLLTCFCSVGADLIKVSPTWKPQSLNAMHRLESILKNWPGDAWIVAEIQWIYLSHSTGADQLSFR